jgi:hypothetical protein
MLSDIIDGGGGVIGWAIDAISVQSLSSVNWHSVQPLNPAIQIYTQKVRIDSLDMVKRDTE